MTKTKAKVIRKPRNLFEKTVLDKLKRAKVKHTYEPEKFPLLLETGYIPDVLLENGIYVELKGYLRPEDKVKLRAFKKQYPDKDLRIVFQKARPSYIKWAAKYGIPSAEAFIPKEWIKE